GVTFLPLATGAAILRYRLYDLDRIVSRTLAYGLLTLLLGGAYALVVLGLGQVVGRDSTLAVGAATLALSAASPPDPRRPPRPRPAHRAVRRPPARPGRPGHPDRRGAGRGHPDHATHPGLAVAAAAGTAFRLSRSVAGVGAGPG